MYTVDELKKKFINEGIKEIEENNGIVSEIYYLYKLIQYDGGSSNTSMLFYNPYFDIAEDGLSADIVNNDRAVRKLRYDFTRDTLQIKVLYNNEHAHDSEYSSNQIIDNNTAPKSDTNGKFNTWKDYDITHHNCMFFDLDIGFLKEFDEYAKLYYEEHPDEVRKKLQSYLMVCVQKRKEYENKIDVAWNKLEKLNMKNNIVYKFTEKIKKYILNKIAYNKTT